MKPAVWVAVISLATNAALIAVIVTREAPHAPGRLDASPIAGATGRAAIARDDGARLRAALESGDPAELEAAGASVETVRSIGVGRAYLKHMERMKTLRSALDQATPPFWQGGADTGLYSTKLRDTRLQLGNASREFQDELARLSGLSVSLSADPRESMFAFLPDHTRRRLSRIEREFSDLAHEVRVQADGVMTAEDKEKQRLVAEEREHVIADLLGPEGYERYLLRTSPIAANVRARYGSVIKDEDQFRAIFELQQDFENAFRANGRQDLAFYDRRREAELQLQHDIAAVLGPDQMRQAKRNISPEHQALAAIAVRFQLPAGTPDVIYSSRDKYADLSQEIRRTEGLTADERAALLRALGDTAFAEVRQILGASGADAYAEHSEWLKALKQGYSISKSQAAYGGPVRIFTH